jgi:hypothetical protein
MQATRGARPIKNSVIQGWYDTHEYQDISLTEYATVWRNWLEFSETKSITGLDKFAHADYTQGTSQTFDQFVIKHSKDRTITALVGEFQYHQCLGKHINFQSMQYFHADQLHGPGLTALIISAPFSDFGVLHPDFNQIMDICTRMDVPVCLDLAYWGISKNVHLDLDRYPCIQEVTCSLSKPFFTLENHRVGIRFTRKYCDDGISMLNEVNMQNKHSMSLGVHYMKNFGPDWNWNTYAQKYEQACDELDLVYTDTVIFGLGRYPMYSEFNRGITHNNRVCISQYLGDTQ